MKPNSNLRAKELMKALAAMPARALLSRATWRRLLTGGRAALPRLGQAFTPGSVSRLAGVTTWTRDEVWEAAERFRIAGFGVRSESDAERLWIIPLTVWQEAGGTPDDTNYRPRAAVLNGALVDHMAEMRTTAEEVPALIGYRTPSGDWANDAPPEWRAVPEADPTRDYPLLVSDPGEVVLATLAAAPIQFPQPLFFVSRY